MRPRAIGTVLDNVLLDFMLSRIKALLWTTVPGLKDVKAANDD